MKVNVWNILKGLEQIIEVKKPKENFKSRKGFVARLVYDIDGYQHFDYRARIFLMVKDGEFVLKLQKLNGNPIREEPLCWFMPSDFVEVNYEQFFKTVMDFLSEFSFYCEEEEAA
ncbi:hypothetical protein [Hippea alviniae]|uniref:hypothetical protein n=1 Tax=Hippea alviniae TaxID=1279027 RepID=UPI0003B4E951|nr:hypothetical protein [Hippea alviniae]